MALSKVNPNFLNVSQVGGRRNLVINGAMQVAQRGTSFTADGYSIDRIFHQLSGGTSTLTQETFPLGSELEGFTKYAKQAVSTGNNYCGILYKVEDVKSLPQGKATLSFYAKGTNPAAGTFSVKIFRMHNGSTVFDTLLDTTVTLTSSWQRFTKTFDVGSLSGMSTPTANSLVYITIRQSGSDTGTAAWELNLTGLQLEVGDTATPFEHRTFDDERERCERYFQKWDVETTLGAGLWFSGNQVLGNLSFRKIMRSSPTMSVSSADFCKAYKNGASVDSNDSASPFDVININGARFNLQMASAGTDGQGALFQLRSSEYIHADAEL